MGSDNWRGRATMAVASVVSMTVVLAWVSGRIDCRLSMLHRTIGRGGGGRNGVADKCIER